MDHTKGPWQAAFPVDKPPFISNEGYVIVQKVWPLDNREEAKANARLIAAAPELYAVLRLVDRYFDEQYPGMGFAIPSRVKAALSLASGKG